MSSAKSIVKGKVSQVKVLPFKVLPFKALPFEAFPFDVWNYCIKPFITTSMIPIPKKCAVCKEVCELSDLHLYKQTTYNDYRCDHCFCECLKLRHYSEAISKELAKPFIVKFEKKYNIDDFKKFEKESYAREYQVSSRDEFWDIDKKYKYIERATIHELSYILYKNFIFTKTGTPAALKKAREYEKIVIKVLKSFCGDTDCNTEYINTEFYYGRRYKISLVKLVK